MTPLWWLLGFLPALLVLYFLKLKREEVRISSTLLWRRSLEDLHVNAPFQRLRRSLLFWLQLAALSFLILAVWRPRCDRAAEIGRSAIVAIDVSGSMKAVEDGTSRFERARDEALALVDRLEPTDRMIVLSFAQVAATVQPLTSDRALLSSRLRSLEPTDLPTDFAAVLETLSEVAESLESPAIWVIGDGAHGGLDAAPAKVQRFEYQFIRVGGKETENVAITQADVRRTYGHTPRTELFALVSSRFTTEKEWTVRIEREGQLIDARRVRLAPGGHEGIIVDVSLVKPGLLEVAIEAGDALETDNRVVLALDEPKPTPVLIVGPENPWLDDVFRSSPEVAVERVTPEGFPRERLAQQVVDGTAPVLVFDRWLPETIPAAPALFIGCHPSDALASVDYKEREQPVIVDWDRIHPVLRDLAFESVRIRRGEVASSEDARFRCLADATDGCLISELKRSRPGGGTVSAIVVGFDILESNWPLGHFSFPIFFDNAIAWLGRSELEKRARWQTGEVLTAKPPPGVEPGAHLRFRDPSGAERPAVAEPGGLVSLGRIERTGVYELLVDGKVVDRFPADLLDDSESNLTPRLEASSKTGDGAATGPIVEAASVRETRELWPWFALAALAFVVLEWYVYHRRTYI